MAVPTLFTIIPCYNEEAVLPLMAPLFEEELESLISKEKISPDSRILFVDDGSKDGTWDIICTLHEQNNRFCGIRQSRNRGHQNALWAGLTEAMDKCDITVTVDCDGQDDITAMESMIDAFSQGADIVYGVRKKRSTDTFFKRITAQGYYKFLQHMGADVVYNHADFRLISSRALHALATFPEVNLFLRGMVPLVGFRSTCVYYDRRERIAGETHYSLGNMLALAFDGITSLSIKPLRLITGLGLLVSLISFAGVLWAVISHFCGNTVAGWASMACIVCFLGGVQLICLGVIGTYIGKIYMEVKHRPRFIISDRTKDE